MSAKIDALGATTGADDVGATVLASQSPIETHSPLAAGHAKGGRTTVLPRVRECDGCRVVEHGAVARYEERELLGQGGVGEVVAALDNDIGRPVAIKRLLPAWNDEASLVRFAEEIRTVGSLEHPNIVPVHDVGLDERGRHFFVMKQVRGETLEAIISKLAAGDPRYHERYGFERRVRIFLGLLEAVRFAHSKGIIHRDIKPSNVMVGPYGEVILMDWGIAKRVAGEAKRDNGPDAADAAAPAPAIPSDSVGQTSAGSVVGTPLYMSPEQARGAALDERSDVYSLAVLFHELLCLRHYLADCGSLAEVAECILRGEPARFESASPRQGPVPADLVWYARKGLEKEPGERYQSVAEMIERLARRSEGQVPVQCPATAMKRALAAANRFVDRHMGIALAGGLVGVLWITGTLTLAAIWLAQALG